MKSCCRNPKPKALSANNLAHKAASTQAPTKWNISTKISLSAAVWEGTIYCCTRFREAITFPNTAPTKHSRGCSQQLTGSPHQNTLLPVDYLSAARRIRQGQQVDISPLSLKDAMLGLSVALGDRRYCCFWCS